MSIIAIDVQKSCNGCSHEEEDAKGDIRILALNTAAWLLSGVWFDSEKDEGFNSNSTSYYCTSILKKLNL